MTMRHAAGGAGPVDEPEREQEPGSTEAPSAPIWKTDEDRNDEGRTETDAAEISRTGAVPGAIAGASAVGPTGGIIGAAAGEKSAAAENRTASDERGDDDARER